MAQPQYEKDEANLGGRPVAFKSPEELEARNEDYLNIKIENLKISSKTKDKLLTNNYLTLRDVAVVSPSELLMPLGNEGMEEIIVILYKEKKLQLDKEKKHGSTTIRKR